MQHEEFSVMGLRFHFLLNHETWEILNGLFAFISL